MPETNQGGAVHGGGEVEIPANVRLVLDTGIPYHSTNPSGQHWGRRNEEQ